MNTRARSQSELWERFARSRDSATRNELVVRYSFLIKAHTRKLARRLSVQVSPDEIASAAFDGLWTAIDTFDPARGVKFETFASKRISGAVLDWLRATDPQPRAVREFERLRCQAAEIAGSETGRQVTDREVAARMGLKSREYERLLRRARAGVCIQFSALPSMNHDDYAHHTGVPEIASISEPAPWAKVAREMLRNYISRGLCAAERTVLILYYFDDLTMAETGAAMGLSESRVSQIHRQVIEKLRSRFGSPEARYALA